MATENIPVFFYKKGQWVMYRDPRSSMYMLIGQVQFPTYNVPGTESHGMTNVKFVNGHQLTLRQDEICPIASPNGGK